MEWSRLIGCEVRVYWDAKPFQGEKPLKGLVSGGAGIGSIFNIPSARCGYKIWKGSSYSGTFVVSSGESNQVYLGHPLQEGSFISGMANPFRVKIR